MVKQRQPPRPSPWLAPTLAVPVRRRQGDHGSRRARWPSRDHGQRPGRDGRGGRRDSRPAEGEPGSLPRKDWSCPARGEDARGEGVRGDAARKVWHEGRGRRARRACRRDRRAAAGRRGEPVGMPRPHQGGGPRGRPGHRQGPRRRPPAPRAGQAQVRSRAAGQPRSQVSYQARRGLSGGLGVCRRRGLAGRSLPHRVPCAGMPPLRHVVRRVLPERTPGEPVRRYGARPRADGRAGMGVGRRHGVRRGPPRLGRQAGLAGRLRDVRGLRGPRDQTMQAEASPPREEGPGGPSVS